jgi:hypothetical protein
MLMALGIHPASALRRLGRAIGAAQMQTPPVSAPVTGLFQIEPQKSAVDRNHRTSDVTRPR